MRDAASADAPGRVNLIGEHTDYHEGFVLPSAIPQRTHVELRLRADRRVRASSPGFSPETLEYQLDREQPGRAWLDYVQGVTATLARHGVRVPGFDLRITSTVPVGAGVSSSAALEVSLLRALRALLSLELDDVTLARLAQAAETEFVGAAVGIMDQMASSLGREGEALFLDTRTLAFERVPLPRSMELVVIDSGIPHANAHGAYAVRRRESFAAAALLGVKCLRDLDLAALSRIAALPAVLARRARHVVTENARVLAAVDALREGSGTKLGTLFAASHASMRDDYETSIPEIDALVAIAEQYPAVYGARLTGGGFGGAIVVAVEAGCGHTTADAIRDAYRSQSGRDVSIVMPTSAGS